MSLEQSKKRKVLIKKKLEDNLIHSLESEKDYRLFGNKWFWLLWLAGFMYITPAIYPYADYDLFSELIGRASTILLTLCGIEAAATILIYSIGENKILGLHYRDIIEVYLGKNTLPFFLLYTLASVIAVHIYNTWFPSLLKVLIGFNLMFALIVSIYATLASIICASHHVCLNVMNDKQRLCLYFFSSNWSQILSSEFDIKSNIDVMWRGIIVNDDENFNRKLNTIKSNYRRPMEHFLPPSVEKITKDTAKTIYWYMWDISSSVFLLWKSWGIKEGKANEKDDENRLLDTFEFFIAENIDCGYNHDWPVFIIITIAILEAMLENGRGDLTLPFLGRVLKLVTDVECEYSDSNKEEENHGAEAHAHQSEIDYRILMIEFYFIAVGSLCVENGLNTDLNGFYQLCHEYLKDTTIPMIVNKKYYDEIKQYWDMTRENEADHREKYVAEAYAYLYYNPSILKTGVWRPSCHIYFMHMCIWTCAKTTGGDSP